MSKILIICDNKYWQRTDGEQICHECIFNNLSSYSKRCAKSAFIMPIYKCKYFEAVRK